MGGGGVRRLGEGRGTRTLKDILGHDLHRGYPEEGGGGGGD